MTEERLAELEALCAAATPGEWVAVCPRTRWRIMAGQRYVMESGADEVRTEADAAFIAAARTWIIPELLAEVRRLSRPAPATRPGSG